MKIEEEEERAWQAARVAGRRGSGAYSNPAQADHDVHRHPATPPPSTPLTLSPWVLPNTCMY